MAIASPAFRVKLPVAEMFLSINKFPDITEIFISPLFAVRPFINPI